MADKFDSKKFNSSFEESKNKTSQLNKKVAQQNLDKLNKQSNTKKEVPLSKVTIGELLVNTKDAWLDIITELYSFNFQLDIFTRNNRMFYIGVSVIIMVVLVYITSIIFSPDDESNNNSKIDVNFNIIKKGIADIAKKHVPASQALTDSETFA
jgi:hypothetical protein